MMEDKEIISFFESQGFSIKELDGHIHLYRGDIHILVCSCLKELYKNYPQ